MPTYKFLLMSVFQINCGNVLNQPVYYTADVCGTHFKSQSIAKNSGTLDFAVSFDVCQAVRLGLSKEV